MKSEDLQSMLDAIASKAKTLRDAGVTAISVGDVSIELAPRDLPEAVTPAKSKLEDEEDERTRALDSKQTFGGREAPSRRRVGDSDDR